MTGKNGITLCITSDELDEKSIDILETFKAVVNEIIIISFKLDSKVKELLEKYDCIICEKNTNSLTIEKNMVLEFAKEEFVLFLSGNETLSNIDIEELLKLIDSKEYDGYYFKEKAIEGVQESFLRLLRNNKEYQFTGVLGEEVSHKYKKINYDKFQEVQIEIQKLKKEKEIEAAEEKIKLISVELEKYSDIYYKYKLVKLYYFKGEYENANYALANIDIDEFLTNEEKVEYTLLKTRILLKISEFYLLEDFFLDQRIENLKINEINYYKGILFSLRNKNILAVKYFKLFLQHANKEEANENYLIEDVYSRLGELYYKENDYEEAIVYYKLTAISNKLSISAYCRYAKSLKKHLRDNNKVVEVLKEEIDIEKLRGKATLAHILYESRIYEYALVYYLEISQSEKIDSILITIGTILMFNQEYKTAEGIFKNIQENSPYKDEAIKYTVIIKLIENSEIDLESIDIKGEGIKRAVNILVKMNSIDDKELNSDLDEKVLEEYIKILDTILNCKELELFEIALNGLNLINSKNILRRLSMLYYKNGFNELSKEEAIRSLTISNKVDEDLIPIIYSNY